MWYAITWLDIDGKPIKRELLDRDNPRKIWQFVKGRVNMAVVPEGSYGFWFSEALPEETWDSTFEEDRAPSTFPDEVPIQPLFER